MLKRPCSSPWMFMSRYLRKKSTLWSVILGAFFAVCQIVDHHLYGGDLGSNMLIARLQFDSLALAVIFLFIAKLLVEGLCARWKMPCMNALVNHLVHYVSRRIAEFVSIAVSTVAGFTIVVAISGAYLHACMCLLFCIYLLSLGETATNPLLRGTQSRTFWPAMGVIIGLPFGM